MLKTKLKNLIYKNFEFLVCAIFVLVVFFSAQAILDIWPFGNSIMASYDLLAQICPSLEHYYNVFEGTSSLFHSFFVGGGMDTFGILAYCSVSPFTILLLLGGKGNVIYMVSIVLPIKVACVACSALWFIKKQFPSIHRFYAVILSLLYATGGYLYIANTYINWLDLMIYMPIVGAGFIKLVKTGSIKLLAVSLALCIYTCFSITCFSFFSIFPIGVAYILICCEKNSKNRLIARFSLSFVVAVALSLPILIPSLYAYMKAGRNTGLFGSVFSSVISADHLYEKFTYFLSGGAFITLIIFYFIDYYKEKFAKFALFAFAILLLPCFIDESMKLLNAGSYYGYSMRFGFVIDFLLFYLGVKSFSLISSSETIYPIKSKTNIISLIILSIFAIGTIVGSIFFFNFLYYGNFEKGQPFYSFFSSFAHGEGGLEVIGITFGILIIIGSIALLLVKFKALDKKASAPILSIIAITQSVFLSFCLVRGDRQNGSAENYDKYAEIISQIDAEENDYYRLKNYDYYISSCSPIPLKYYAHTLFNSMADEKNLKLPGLFKYGGNLTNSSKSNRGGMFSDALLGYKYFVYKTDDFSNGNRSYLYNTDFAYANYKVKKNTLAFPLAAVVNGNLTDEKLNPALEIINIINFLSGEKHSFTELSPDFSKNDDGSVEVKIHIPKASDCWYWHDFPADYFPLKLSADGEYLDLPEYYFYDFTKYASTRSVTIKKKQGETVIDEVKKYFHAFSVDTSQVAEIRDKLNAKKVNYELKAGEILFPDKILAEEGDKLYLGYVNIEGFEATVNGKKVPLTENFADFIIIDLEQGENIITLKYTSPYYKYIFWGLTLGILILIFVYLIYNKKSNAFNKIERFLSYTGISLSAVIIVFFFIFPTLIFIYKAIVLLF